MLAMFILDQSNTFFANFSNVSVACLHIIQRPISFYNNRNQHRLSSTAWLTAGRSFNSSILPIVRPILSAAEGVRVESSLQSYPSDYWVSITRSLFLILDQCSKRFGTLTWPLHFWWWDGCWITCYLGLNGTGNHAFARLRMYINFLSLLYRIITHISLHYVLLSKRA